MTIPQFDYLLDLISAKISKCGIFRRDVIPPELRLLVTLRHVVTGMDYCSLAFEYLLGRSTIHSFIPETCAAICDLKNIYLSWPNDLEIVSDGFRDQYCFPHCCGAVDGKHIRIQKPKNSGSLYYNYKQYFSIVLLAVCDADANFIYVNVGGYGSQADGNVWTNCALGKTLSTKKYSFLMYDINTTGTAIRTGEINWPPSKNLPNSTTEYHYFFIGDEAFPVSKHLLRPYSGRNLDGEKTYFNEKQKSTRNVIERTFGIFANMFRIFRGELQSTPKNAERKHYKFV